jgi:hypothetical protein
MSFFAIYLCLVLIPPFSSATHPFEELSRQNRYPVTNYDNSIAFDSATSSRGLHRNIYGESANLVYSNLQPDPYDARPGPSRSARGSLTTVITCFQNELPIPDCEAAINIIPTGHLVLESKDAHSLATVESPKSVKWNAPLPRPLRKFHLPAAFRAGECVVFVRHFRYCTGKMAFFPPVEPPAGFNAAMFMYHTVWPNSRRLAQEIIKKCDSRGGVTETSTSPESNKAKFQTFRYSVKIGRPKADAKEDNLKDYNVYE